MISPSSGDLTTRLMDHRLTIALALPVLMMLGCMFGAVTSASMADSTDDNSEIVDIQETAHYYLKELRRSMDRLSALRTRRSRAKRDTQASESDEKSDFLFDSVLNFCHHIQSFDSMKTKRNGSANTGTTDVAQPDDGDGDGDREKNTEKWFQPEVRPITVQATREGENKVEIAFNIVQSVSSEVSRFAGFDLEELKFPQIDAGGKGEQEEQPQQQQQQQQKAVFSVDTSHYCQEENRLDNQFVFAPDGRPLSHVQLYVDVCRFDQFQNESLDWELRKWVTREGPILEGIALPKISFDPATITNGDHSLVIEPGRNASFDLTADLDDRTNVIVSATYYDRPSKTMSGEHSYLTLGTDGYVRSERRNEDIPFIQVDLLNVSTVPEASPPAGHGTSGNAADNDDGDGDDEGGIKQMRARVTLITESGSRTGKVTVTINSRRGDYYDRTIVTRVSLGTAITVRRAGKQSVYPRRKVLFQDYDAFLCNEDGNIRRSKHGRNCTLYCMAFGRDLQALTISKKGSTPAPIYRELTTKLSDRIFSIVDVGPVSSAADDDIEGTYDCTVTGFKGYTKVHELKLFISGFPKIDVDRTTLLKVDDITTLVTCTVHGRLPIEVKVKTRTELSVTTTISDANNTTRISERADKNGVTGTVTMTLEVPTDQLRSPMRVIEFDASSVYGHDHHSIYLSHVIDNYEGRPSMVQEETSLVTHGNGTTVITCTARGRGSLDIWITFGSLDKAYRIDTEPGYQRVERVMDGGKTSVTLYVDTQSLIRSDNWLTCEAHSEYGMDTEEFNLNDYIDVNKFLFD